MTRADFFLDLRQLQTFLTVVEQRGVSAAARRLGVSQPSVSQQMRRLERGLGHAIFARKNAGSTLTADGEALVIFARAMFSVADQVRDHFGRRDLVGTLRVGFNEDFARTALPGVLALFARSFPHLELMIDCNVSSRHLFAELDEGRLDLVVAKMALAEIRGRTLWVEHLRWIGRRRDMRFGDEPIPLVCASTPNVARELVFEALAAAGRRWRTRFQSPSLSALEAAICSGLGVGAIMKGMATGGAEVLDEACGLPPLPEVALCLDSRAGTGDPSIAAFAALLQETMLQVDPRRSPEKNALNEVEGGDL